jgi:hypothetical protein
MVRPWVSPVITAVAGALADMAGVGMHHHHHVSTCSTVRNAVLNAVFSGTRSMPKRM